SSSVEVVAARRRRSEAADDDDDHRLRDADTAAGTAAAGTRASAVGPAAQAARAPDRRRPLPGRRVLRFAGPDLVAVQPHPAAFRVPGFRADVVRAVSAHVRNSDWPGQPAPGRQGPPRGRRDPRRRHPRRDRARIDGCLYVLAWATVAVAPE